MRPADGRTWLPTDRPGERVCIARPLAGVEILSVQHSHRHWREAHDDFTIALVHREQEELVADWRTRCRTQSTERGGLMLIEPGDMHVTQRLKARRGAASFDVVRFSPELVAQAARHLGIRGDFHFRTPSARDPVVFDALDRLVTTVARGDDSLLVECAGNEALTTLIMRLAERPNPHGLSLAAERDYRLRRVNDYLASHLARRPTLAELEHVSGLSQWRLCARFNESQGTSIGRCWNALRFRRALRKLQSGSSPRMIAAELGYRDEAYLCRVFKAHYGISPGAWRSMFHANDRRNARSASILR
jgi:AraC-like DNA-binding protein